MKIKSSRPAQQSALRTQHFFLLTAFGPDHPGMVASVTHLVYQLKGNIEDASMTRLGGEFAMMLVVGLPSARAGDQFLKDLPRLQKGSGLSLSAKPVSSGLAHRKRPTQATHLISVYGTDRPGIVYKVTQALASRRINITDLQTKTLDRAGKSLYVMLLEVQIQSHAKVKTLERALRQIGRALRLEVTLQDLEAVSL